MSTSTTYTTTIIPAAMTQWVDEAIARADEADGGYNQDGNDEAAQAVRDARPHLGEVEITVSREHGADRILREAIFAATEALLAKVFAAKISY